MPPQVNAKSCLKSDLEVLTTTVIPFWLERCYETEIEVMNQVELRRYRQLNENKDCRAAREIYTAAFLRRHPKLPFELPVALEGTDWLRFIIERNAHDLYFCTASVKLRSALAEMERLGLNAEPFPGFREAIEAGQAGTIPAAVDDRNHALMDLGWLAQADHAPAQALIVEMALGQEMADLMPGYGLFLIERAMRRGQRIGNPDALRLRASDGLPGEVIREIAALAAQPKADYFDWYYRQPKGRLGGANP